jgi:SAM-dependent methyltransferase
MNRKAFTCPFCGCTSNDLTPQGSEYAILKELEVIGADRRLVGCPNCNSTDRERLVYLYLRDYVCLFSKAKQKVLHIAPEYNLSQKIMEMKDVEYIAGDSLTQGYNFPKYVKQMDIRSIPNDDNHFDWLICNHVLQDVKEDRIAMREMWRVLKVGGKAIIQVPLSYKLETTIEEKTEGSFSKEERRERYGFEYHIRIYQASDFIDRLKGVGFFVNTIFLPSKFQIFEINSKECVHLCTKI